MLNLTHCEPYLTPVSSGWARVSTCTVQPYQVRTLYLVLNTKLLAVVVSVGLLAVGLIVLIGDHPLAVRCGNIAVLVVGVDAVALHHLELGGHLAKARTEYVV